MKRWRQSPFSFLGAALLLVAIALSIVSCESSSPTEPTLIADFTFLGKGLVVEFVDTSKGHIVSWLWEFGDQARSSVQHPTHEYIRADTYIVRLTVCNQHNTDDPERCDVREKAVTVPIR
jgi:PKD repeat protein